MLRMSEVNQVDHAAMQHPLTEGCVDWVGLGHATAWETDALLGRPEPVLLIDESGFSKKGVGSAGVARPLNTRLGKVDHGQVGMFATLCRDEMPSLIDPRRYLPKAWAEDATRGRKAALPEEAQRSRSKTEFTLEMIEPALARGGRFVYLGLDGRYGEEPALLREVDRLGCRFVVDVHCDQTLTSKTPHPGYPRGRGGVNRRCVARPQPPRVDDWAAAQPAAVWRRLRLRQEENGRRVAEFLHTHVWRWDSTETEARCWHLLVRREVGARKIPHYVLCNAPLPNWPAFRRSASSSNTAFARRRVHAVWPTIRSAVERPGIITWPW